ncbi:MAG TPA: SDR family oxidoreductase, partial [Gemmatimonadaceae bacterium]|nr:SDR family oxidoreductase [Gemmatimonadaceae bacterium]
MSKSLKPLNEQVIVITGASSGIGLATTLLAAESGAKLVIAARSEETLNDVAHHIRSVGGEAVAVGADVGNRDDLERVAQTAIDRFGRIDTWVNDAGVSIYSRILESSDEDNRRLFDTNFWGIVYGTQVAMPHLQRSNGALINLGSEVSEAVVPLQGIYSASKHAVKGFTDALRVELLHDKVEVSVTLIQPGATDTPFPQHARNYMEQEPALPKPLDDPFDVAKAILEAATTEKRSIKVGGESKLNVLMAKFAPKLADKIGTKQMERQQYAEPPRNP